MKKSVIVGVFLVGVLGTVFYIYNYQTTQQEISLNTIFAGEESYSSDVEYEYVGADGKTLAETAAAMKLTPTKENPAQITQPIEKAAQTIQTVAATIQEADQVIAEKVTTPVSSLAKSAFTIQVASLKDKTGAERVLKDVTTKSYSGFIVPRDLGDKGTWYRVYVGQFDIKSEADAFLAKVKQDFPDSFVIAPKP
jgi:cell division septation protein DedD